MPIFFEFLNFKCLLISFDNACVHKMWKFAIMNVTPPVNYSTYFFVFFYKEVVGLALMHGTMKSQSRLNGHQMRVGMCQSPIIRT